jgi:hypothetical protein
MLVAPQAQLGLAALRPRAQFSFPGDALLGGLVLLAGITGLMGGKEPAAPSPARQSPEPESTN